MRELKRELKFILVLGLLSIIFPITMMIWESLEKTCLTHQWVIVIHPVGIICIMGGILALSLYRREMKNYEDRE